jgi:hypothetical protein
MENIKNVLNQITILMKKNEEILNATGGRFNMFQICGVNHYENTHSAIISEFLNPEGTHSFKSKLLQCYVDLFCVDESFKQRFNCENAHVYTEYETIKGRIDILIEDNKNHAIIIENKIYANDQQEQLKRYSMFAEAKYGKGNYEVFYLTLFGDDASEQSGQDVCYKSISYEKDIIAWLEKCACMAVYSPMVRETINQYINHLKSLTNQDMNTKNIEEIVQLLSRSENLESVFAIGSNFSKVKNHIINKVFLPQLTSICEELMLNNVSDANVDRVGTKWAIFRIQNPSWKYFEIGFEFGEKELKSLYYGIYHINENIRNDETFDKLKSCLNNTWRSNKTWIWKQFPTYVNWGKEAFIAINNGTMAQIFKEKIVKILELTKDLEM